jgi:RimJ/RimL family protein N-acetyltransferase
VPNVEPGGAPDLGRLPLRVETARLVLEPWAPADRDDLLAALAESVEHLKSWIPWATGQAPTIADVDVLIERWASQRVTRENLIYAARTKADGTLAGGISLHARVGPRRLEVGYWIRAGATGQGLASEGAGAATAIALALPDVDAVELHTDTLNAPSRRVAEKLGFTLVEIRKDDKMRNGRMGDTAVYVRATVES